MVAPVSALMESFKAIVNNENLNDDMYVFVKGGRAQTETRFQHHFTGRDRKEKTAQRLLADLTAHYGRQAGDALRPLLADYARGEHQIKVGTLRRVFQAAESARLAAVRAAIPRLADVLAPLEAHVARGRVVTHEQVSRLVKRSFREAGDVVMAAHQNVDLCALTDLFNEASITMRKLGQLEEPVKKAVVEFCRRGAMTKAGALAVLAEKLGVAEDAGGACRSLIRRLPEDEITVSQAMDFFKEVQKEKNRDAIRAFIAQLNDPLLSQVVELDRWLEEGRTFSPEIGRFVVEDRAKKAEPWLAAAREVLAEAAARGAPASESFVTELARHVVTCSDPIDKQARQVDVPEFKRRAQEQLLRETDFSFALEYEVRKSKFSPAMEAAYRDAMLYLRKMVPPQDLFIRPPAVGGRLAGCIKRGEFDGLQNPGAVMKAAAIVGVQNLPWIKEKEAELSAAFEAGDVSISRICAILYGVNVPSPVPDVDGSLADVQDAFEKIHGGLCARIYARLPGAGRPGESWETTMTLAAGLQQTGMNLEGALAILKDPMRVFTLADLSGQPKSSILGFETVAKAQAEVEANFSRQRRGDGLLGEAVVIVTQPDGSGMVVDNSTEDLTNEEAAKFVKDERTVKHEKIYDALKTLCGGNDAQYIRALAELTPSGTASFMRMPGSMMKGGAAAGMEHAPLLVSYARTPEGDVVVESRTPEDLPVAQLSARLVIHPDGRTEYSTLSITPREAAA